MSGNRQRRKMPPILRKWLSDSPEWWLITRLYLYPPNEKLDVKVLFPIWGQEGAEFGLSVDAGFCLRVVKDDTDILYEVIQQHTLSKEWEPGLDTASLYKVIDKEHAGTIGDPIPYFPPMEIFKDKYYIQNADVYKCTRDSGTPLSHNLKDLIGLYVEVVQG